MKTLLVLCAVVAMVYGDAAEITFENNDKCIGILHTTKSTMANYQICCNEKFDRSTKITGFSKTMKKDDVKPALMADMPKLQKGRTGCHYIGK